MTSLSFTVDNSPQEVFKAITNVGGWWTGTVEGDPAGEFTYRYEELHYSKQQVVELVADRKVVWRVTEAHLTFVADPARVGRHRDRLRGRPAGRADRGPVHARGSAVRLRVLRPVLERVGLLRELEPAPPDHDGGGPGHATLGRLRSDHDGRRRRGTRWQ